MVRTRLPKEALMKLDRVVATLGMGLLLCGFTDPTSRLEANDGVPDASQAASVRPASNPSSSETSGGSTDIRSMTAEDAIRAASVASPYKISERAAMGKIRYRIAMRDGISWPWPETGEQHVEHDGDAVVLTVCHDCGAEAPPSAAELQRDLQPNRWADNSDGNIRMLVSDIRGATVDRRMRWLVQAVQLQMNGRIDFNGYLTSREAFDAEKGDCTELALLLAAAAKARHIPVRVVAGIAYASRFLGKQRIFAPHMWVQAWNGSRWTSYDAGIGEFDSTHIVLTIGDGSPDTLPAAFAKLQALRIESAQGLLPALASGR
jgi:hypothetical protein